MLSLKRIKSNTEIVQFIRSLGEDKEMFGDLLFLTLSPSMFNEIISLKTFKITFHSISFHVK